MALEWPKTMTIQNGLDNMLGQFPMSLGDTIEPAKDIGVSISLYDLERRLFAIELRQERLMREIIRVQERVYHPWYLRLWDATRNLYARIRRRIWQRTT